MNEQRIARELVAVAKDLTAGLSRREVLSLIGEHKGIGNVIGSFHRVVDDAGLIKTGDAILKAGRNIQKIYEQEMKDLGH